MRAWKAPSSAGLLLASLPRVWGLLSVLDGLLADYDYTSRPSGNGPVDKVFVNFGVESLAVDQTNQNINFDGYFRSYWTDPRLQFPGNETMILPSNRLQGGKELWTPGVYVQNAGTMNIAATDDEALRLNPDGSIFRSRRMHMELNCRSFTYGQVPWDTQYCHMIVGVYRYKATEVEADWYENGIDVIDADGLKHGEWSVELVEVRKSTKQYITGRFTYALACFRLRRRSFFFPVTIGIALLLVVATYSGLFVTHEAAPARVSLAFLCFLMVITNFNAVQGRLPAVSSETRIWLLDFFMGTMFFNFLLLLEYAVVNFLATRKKREAAERSLYEAEVKRIFETFDEARTGSLNAEGVRRMCEALGLSFDEDQVAQLINIADTSGNGSMEFGELMTALDQMQVTRESSHHMRFFSALHKGGQQARHLSSRVSSAVRMHKLGTEKYGADRSATGGASFSSESSTSRGVSINTVPRSHQPKLSATDRMEMGMQQAAAARCATRALEAGKTAASTAKQIAGVSKRVANATQKRIKEGVMKRAVSVTDARCRWLFPLCYGFFLLVLACAWPFYDHLETCHYE